MCDPATFLAAASAGVKGITALGQGASQSSLDKFAASIADTNAKLAEGNVGLAQAKGALDIGRTATAVTNAVGGAVAHYGASHLDPTYGSPLFNEANSVLQGQGDMALINAKTAAGVASAKAAEASAVNQAEQLRMKAGNDMMSGYFGAATALLAPGVTNLFKGAQWPWQSGATGNSSVTPQFYTAAPGTDWG